MSKTNYTRNLTTTYFVRCIFFSGGKFTDHVGVSYAQSEKLAIEETFANHIWSNLPSFMCGVVRTVRYE